MPHDLRRVFGKIMKDWGHDVMLQRRVIKAQATTGYALAPNDGFETNLERWTVRHTYPRQTALAKQMRSVPEGITIDSDLLYYFPWNSYPKDGDRIYEMDDRYKKTPQAQHFSAIYLVDYAIPLRGKGGRIEYWVVGCTRESPN